MLSSDITTTANVTLDLNGHSIDLNEKAFNIASSSFSITDTNSETAGSITNGTVSVSGRLTIPEGAGMKIDELSVAEGASASLSGGKFGKISVASESRSVRDLLAEGMHYWYPSGSSEHIRKDNGTSISGWNDDVITVHACKHRWWGDTCNICGTPCLHEELTRNEKTGLYECRNCEQEMIAKLNDTYHADLLDTMYAAEKMAGEPVILMLADAFIPGVSSLSIAPDGNYSIDTNGKTISSCPTFVTSGLRRLFGGGTITSETVSVNGNLTIEDVKITNTIEVGDGNNTGILNITGGEINTLTVNNGKVRISGGTFANPFTLAEGISYADLLVEGYAFAKDGKLLKLSEVATEKNFTVKKCTDHTELDKNGKCLYCGLAFVAKVGNTSYTTLSAAFVAAGRSGTVTLIGDVSLTDQLRFTSGNLTLDLNGKKITCDVIGNAIQVSGGTLTIKDSSANKNGELCDGCNETSAAVCVSGGRLILESGNYTTSGDYSTAVKQTGGSLEIKGGRFAVSGGETSHAVLLEGGTEFKISGDPKIEASAGMNENTQRCLVIGENYSGKVSLAGGTFGYIKLKNKMTVKDLLAADYGFKTGESMWATAEQLTGDEIASVTVLKAPIQGLDYPKNLSMNYGETKEITAEAVKDSSVAGEVSYQWYMVNEDGPQSKIAGGENGNFALPVLPVGQHMFRVAAICDGYTYMGGDITVTVNKAAPTYEPPTANANLSYDGNEQELIASGSSTDGKMVYSLEKDGVYSENIPTGINAGTYEIWYKVIGDENHTDTEPKSIEATVAPCELNSGRILFDEASLTKPYDGTADTNARITGFTGRDGKIYQLEEGVDYKLPYMHYGEPNVGNVGLRFELILLNENYIFPGIKTVTAAYPANITKAAAPIVPKTGELTIVKGEAGVYSFDLKSLLPKLAGDCIYGSVKYGTPSLSLDAVYGADASISDGILTLKTAPTASAQAAEDGKITIGVETRNYETFTLTVNIKATDKKQPQLDGELTLSRDTLTYGEALSSIGISGKMTADGAEVEGTFTWLNPDALPNASEAYTAGWKFKPNSDEYAEVTGTATMKVNKADPTGTPQYTPIRESGKTLTDANLTTEGGNFSPAGYLYWAEKNSKGDFTDITSLASLYEVKQSEAWWWVFEPYDTENYNEMSGTIVLWPKSSGGGGSSTVTPTEPTNPTQPTEPTKPDTSDGTLTPAQSKLAKGVQNTTILLKSKLLKSGKIRLTWTKSKGYKVDRFEIYRSVKKNSGYGKKAFFATKDGSWLKYLNTKELKKGKTYYYKLRGVRTIGGKKYYTKWSNKTWKTIK